MKWGILLVALLFALLAACGSGGKDLLAWAMV